MALLIGALPVGARTFSSMWDLRPKSLKEYKQRLKAAKTTENGTAVGTPVNFHDDVTEVRADSMLRYVFTYTAAEERATETIYLTRRLSNNQWSNEVLYDYGVYAYTYDTQKRVTSKLVRYEKGNATSYRVDVSYDSNNPVFRKYEDDGNGNLTELVSSWECYPDGKLAAVYKYDDNSATTLRSSVQYDKSGNVVGSTRLEFGEPVTTTTTGALNDSTLTVTYNDGNIEK